MVTDAQVPLPPGHILGGNYELRGLLGKGGFGLTYQAYDVSLNKLVAIKEFLPFDVARRGAGNRVEPVSPDKAGMYSEFLAGFKEEAGILVRMSHRSIVQVLRRIEANNTAYYVMDYLDGETLGAACKRLARLPPSAVMLVVEQLLDGLHYVHENNLLHRDIKPDNIMLTRSRDPVRTRLVDIPDAILSEYGHPVLIDFGSARVFRGTEDRAMTGFFVPGYTPLEQLRGDVRQDERTDIYSLAATAYTALTGNRPDDAETRSARDDVRRIGAILEGSAPAAFLSGIDHGLAVNIAGRPVDMAAWRRELFPPRRDTAREPEPFVDDERGRRARPAVEALRNPILILVALLLIGAGFFAVRQCSEDGTRLGEHGNGTMQAATVRGRFRAETGRWQRVSLAALGIEGRFALTADGPFRIRVGSAVYTVAGNRPVDLSRVSGADIQLKAIGARRDIAISSIAR